MLVFDHIALSATTLAEGTAAIEEALGVTMTGGGQHPHMATHNRLLGLGDVYLEAIAADPAQPRPAWPRWFDLDSFSGPPRLTNWIAACDDLAAELALSPQGTGQITQLQRGDYRWEMAVPANGKLPFDGAFPALIHWHGHLHPARALPDTGCRLTRLEIAHPEGAALAEHLAPRLTDPRIVLTSGPKAMQATIATPHGTRTLR